MVGHRRGPFRVHIPCLSRYFRGAEGLLADLGLDPGPPVLRPIDGIHRSRREPLAVSGAAILRDARSMRRFSGISERTQPSR